MRKNYVHVKVTDSCDCKPKNASDFGTSKLGTKQYWDNVYNRESINFKDFGDTGDVWYGEGSMERVLDWIEENCIAIEQPSIIDLGSGNGILLLELSKRGYDDLTGIDYSEGAVELARNIAKQEHQTSIKFEVADILCDPVVSASLQRQYNVCIDKGTYDAMSLCPDEPRLKRLLFKRVVLRLLTERGLFVITSCNWTKEELLTHFQPELTLHKEIHTPSFQFGGSSGSTVVSLVFAKKG
ncbi:PREDICTED: protein-lysine N-methyltransferase mettl10-like [Priapulus caudatus]|uniref:Protein-lysine N-methyltransferase LOC106806450 n=1 Tax=Priapulus caudatus TaxID=37621 RepID=A0ABM1DVA3_PRICU|nr:PREDICTED: protein-lysine N-methyltransferase mettl10-like [Priapulus caudatus]